MYCWIVWYSKLVALKCIYSDVFRDKYPSNHQIIPFVTKNFIDITLILFIAYGNKCSVFHCTRTYYEKSAKEIFDLKWLHNKPLCFAWITVPKLPLPSFIQCSLAFSPWDKSAIIFGVSSDTILSPLSTASSLTP